MSCRTYSLLLCSLAFIVGCGEDSMPIDPIDPVIESTNVDDGATGVGILTVFEATASHDLDDASVTSETVRLVDSKGVAIVAEVSYDEAARTIQLQPIRPLAYDETYQWQIAGVQAQDGQALADVTVELTTYINPIVRSIGYDEATQEVSSYSLYLREGGMSLGTNRYVGPGTDGQWFTDDDELGSYRRISFDAMGRTERSISYTDPGPDQEWFTADDIFLFYSDWRYNADGYPEKNVYYASPGPDNEWFNEDDEVSRAYTYTYHDDGRGDLSFYYTGSGPDRQWFTEDDERASYTVRIYDAQGWLVGARSYSDPGPDATWETADDVLDGYGRNVHNDRGVMIEGMSYGEPGPDSEWFTADDLQSSSFLTTYDQEWNRVEETSIYNPGPDGQWGTADDPISSRAEYDPGY